MDMRIEFTNTLDDRLTDTIRMELHTEEQQQFAIHFQLYLVYGRDDKKFVVDLDNIWEWLGFATKQKAKNLLIKNFQENEDYTTQQSKQVHCGRNREQILMNVETFKGLCMLANTEKGKKTRKYYSKMESIFFKYIEDKHKHTVRTIELDFKKQKAFETHRKLIETHKNTPLVYLLKVSETDEHTFILKLGETDDINTRITSLRSEYKDAYLLDVFPCQRPHSFEQYLFHRKDVLKHKLSGTEMVSITPEFTYAMLVKIIKKNVDNFNGLTEIEKLKMSYNRNRDKLIDLISNTDDMEIKRKLVDALAKSYETDKISELHMTDDSDDDEERNDIAMSNRRVFKYNVCDLKNPIAIYYSLKEAARSLNVPTIHDYHIRNACVTNTIFANYRWFYLDDTVEAPDTIPDTAIVSNNNQQRRKGLVVQLNKEKTKIINVFPSQEDASKSTKIKPCSITTAITKKKIASGYYWEMYDNCDENLKTTFDGELPEPTRIATSSKSVDRIDPITNEILEKYPCIQDVCNTFRTCHKTIHNASKTGEIYKGFKWNIVT